MSDVFLLHLSRGLDMIYEAKPHTKDSDCTIDTETLCCNVCGVEHGDVCPDCGGRGFHKPTCAVLIDTAVAEKHEEILAGLANERYHSRIADASGRAVRWTYNGNGTMEIRR
jgi:hypothetical protein